MQFLDMAGRTQWDKKIIFIMQTLFERKYFQVIGVPT